jgi:hypothetical protein
METLLEGVTLGCAQAHAAHPVAPLMRTRSAREYSAWHLYGTRVTARKQRSATSVTLTVSVPGNGGGVHYVAADCFCFHFSYQVRDYCWVAF